MNAGALITVPDAKDLVKIEKKFDKWCKLYLDKTNPETFGNATKSALAVYKSKNYHTAAAIGHQNYKKLQLTGLEFEELDGRGAADWFKIAASKAIKGSYEQTIDFMQKIGLIESTKVPGSQQNFQFNFGDLVRQVSETRRERGLPVNESDSTTPNEPKVT